MGQSKSGLDLYRVPVTFSDGSYGEVDIEQRVDSSVPLFVFDPTKTQPGTGTTVFSPKAQAEGWTVALEAMAYAYGDTKFVSVGGDSSQWGLYVDPNGRKHVKDGNWQKIGAGGYRLRRSLPDEAGSVDVNVAVVKPGGRDSVGPGHPQRATINGDVTIRVPLPAGKADDELTAEVATGEVSRLLEAVGIPPGAQGAPSNEHLALWALRKVNKQYAPTYSHKKSANVAVANPGNVQAYLDSVSDAIKSMKKPMTLDDVRFRIWESGRVSVVVSDEVAVAAEKAQGLTHFHHHLYTDAMETILAGTTSSRLACHQVRTTGTTPGTASSSAPGGAGRRGKVSCSRRGRSTSRRTTTTTAATRLESARRITGSGCTRAARAGTTSSCTSADSRRHRSRTRSSARP
jgi:hypothetical protein